ncbi:MAG: CcmD family protein [Sphingobacteriaceae bacterium]|jgi:CcmD family protein|nr:CcmD family protein [Sphingobacteriaceae bacterium]
MKKLIALFFILLATTTLTFAQEPSAGTAIDMRSSGKIYVVIAVILIIFIGLAVYLFSIDKRLKKLERNK